MENKNAIHINFNETLYTGTYIRYKTHSKLPQSVVTTFSMQVQKLEQSLGDGVPVLGGQGVSNDCL